ncbi:uncharacterized protein LOC144717330 [Lampetra planeri]
MAAAAEVTAPSPHHAAYGGGTGEAWSDFPAWLAARGVGPRAVVALESALGIGDYAALRACAEHGALRAELIAAARDRLPFGCYAVLRRLVERFVTGTDDEIDDGFRVFVRGCGRYPISCKAPM